MCDQLQGTLSNRRTWPILRTLLGKAASKATSRQFIMSLIHNHQAMDEDVLLTIKMKVFRGQPQQATVITPTTRESTYNSEMDRPFSKAEMEAVPARLTRNATPVGVADPEEEEEKTSTRHTRPGADSERSQHPMGQDDPDLGPEFSRGWSWNTYGVRASGDGPEVAQLVRRVANRKHRLKNQDNLRLAKALMLSRITNGAPYLCLGTSGKKKINLLIKKTYKLAMGLFPTASAEKLVKLGVHNTWEERLESHRASQLERTSLAEMAPISRHMHPEYHGERRARVESLVRMYEGKIKNSPRYTDAAKYAARGAYALSVVDGSGRKLEAACTETWITDSAEGAAIALAATTGRGCTTIITDSQAACRNYQGEKGL
ncbi:hypothetical protein HPB47_002964 [Ixodes persulcatus]|uniref:Uncharacterized protein n=1 Tax=Ixodes persulcatus TaxID=34615 RepID=A0AC60PJQ0_IXOPE|nr:hypothetical protein HPB47_002964 [Ixodes persulcatus]